MAAGERPPSVPQAAAAAVARTDGDALLTPAEMERYRQGLPEAERARARLRALPLAYSVEPDFIFRAAPPRPAAAARARRRTQP